MGEAGGGIGSVFVWRRRIGVALLGMSAATAFAQTSAQRTIPGTGGAEVLLVDPVASPRTLLQLIRASSVIVDGTVSGLLTVINTREGPGAPRLETHSIVAVNAVLYGRVPNGSANLLMAQIGGRLGDRSVSAEGDPLVLPGERYVLFLVPDARRELPNRTGMPRYAVTGVWSGKAKIVDGRVVFAAAASPELKTYDGQRVNAFLGILKETIDHPWSDAGLPIH